MADLFHCSHVLSSQRVNLLLWLVAVVNIKALLVQGTQCDVNYHLKTRGVIETPNYPNNYPLNIKCRWRITIPEGYNQITFYMVKFDVDNTGAVRRCMTDFLEISQIIEGKREIQGRYCGDKGPLFKTVAYGRHVKLKFYSNGFGVGSGFRIYWFANLGCGGLLKGLHGRIASPNFPRPYPNDAYCRWEIKADRNDKAIQLNFKKFSLQKHMPLCRKDSLIIKTKNGSLQGKFCGSTIPAKMEIDSSHVILVLRTNRRKAFNGFLVDWKSVERKEMSCGVAISKPKRFRRIVGGYEQEPSTFPWMVQITTYLSSSGRYRSVINCGGVLIGNRWILTAAHCFASQRPLIHVKVYLGGHFNKDPDAKIVTVHKTHVHPEYRGGMRGDMALLELKEAIEYTTKIRNICLPSTKPGDENDSEAQESSPKPLPSTKSPKRCWIAGWGRTWSGRASTVLKTSEVLSIGKCSLLEFVCAKRTNDSVYQGPCHGDSGGPLMCQNEAGQFTVEGVLSHGAQNCGQGYDFFSSANHSKNWIEKTMKNSGMKVGTMRNEIDENSV